MALVSAATLVVSLLFMVQGASGTLEINGEQLEILFQSGKNAMVKFYQPWCGHCKAMKPAWDNLAEETNDSVGIVDVNCSDHPDVCRAEGVKGYPTIHVYTEGTHADYQGGRTFEELYNYVDENLATHCLVNKVEECDRKSQTYVRQWKEKKDKEKKKELKRLEELYKTRVNMTYELKRWMKDRIQILKQLIPAPVEAKDK